MILEAIKNVEAIHELPLRFLLFQFKRNLAGL